jgi:hypothetical protein
MREKLEDKFSSIIREFFKDIEHSHENEIRLIDAQKLLSERKLNSLMTLLHQQFELGNINEEVYKSACLIYSGGDKDNFEIINN